MISELKRTYESHEEIAADAYNGVWNCSLVALLGMALLVGTGWAVWL